MLFKEWAKEYAEVEDYADGFSGLKEKIDLRLLAVFSCFCYSPEESVDCIKEARYTRGELYDVEIEFFKFLLKNIPSKVKKKKDILAQIKQGDWTNLELKTREELACYLRTITGFPRWSSLNLDWKKVYYALFFPREYKIWCRVNAILNVIEEIDTTEKEYQKLLKEIEKKVDNLYRIVDNRDQSIEILGQVDLYLPERLKQIGKNSEVSS